MGGATQRRVSLYLTGDSLATFFDTEQERNFAGMGHGRKAGSGRKVLISYLEDRDEITITVTSGVGEPSTGGADTDGYFLKRFVGKLTSRARYCEIEQGDRAKSGIELVITSATWSTKARTNGSGIDETLVLVASGSRNLTDVETKGEDEGRLEE